MVAVVSEHLALKRVGRRYQGLCPFHAEKTPSFSVNPELGLYHCFGCGVGGDAIRFIREIEHLDFATAVERLAAKANITLRYDDAACHDRYGRLLAYVAVDGREINALLVERGYACVLYLPPAGTSRHEAFEALEAAARAQHRGLWAACEVAPCE